MATSLLAKYILSEKFHRAACEGVREAVARTRAAGLEPAGTAGAKGSFRLTKVTTIEGPPLKVTVIEGENLEQWLKARREKRSQ
ncbi:hypothetical protein [Cupriavidus campinensis]|uniref:Uncharacterized protein n=1 Tax=Cupriavidus campinensis TaxID=151783 RepID=A0AAE9L0L5_9BURK|nr:hypothetical protein [Cupriavidus campinensis]URF04002.1 hypothetical protein M5D45_16195 [Cupriavidus campinensis]